MSRRFDAGRLSFAGLLALALLLRGIESFGRPLQVDEAYTLWLARLPFAQLLQRLSSHDVHPPLFFVLLHPFSTAGFPDWFFRALMFGLSIGSLAVFYSIVRLWTNESAARSATVTAALMPSLIYYDSWVRMYVLFHLEALLSLLLLTILLTRQSLEPRVRRWLWIAWAACTLASWYTLYLGFAVTAAQLWFAAMTRRDALARMAAGVAAGFVAWLPQLPTFLHQQQFGGVAFGGFRGREGVAFGLLSGNAVFAQLELTTAAIVLSIVAWLWAIAALVVTVRTAGRTVLPWLGAPSALLIGYSLMAHKLLYGDRYHLLFAYAVAAWSGVTIAAAWSQSSLDGRRKVGRYIGNALAAAGAVALIGMAGVRVLNADYSTAPWPQIATFLKANERPGDLFVLDQGNSSWILARYGATEGHATLEVFGRPPPRNAAAPIASFSRIWYVGFQSYPVDPTELILNQLLKHWNLVGAWHYDHDMPVEHVFIALFQR
jgi:hypothetical protein